MLELKNVNSFYGKAQSLFDVSFAVAPGEAVALLGRNGAGKSTVLKTIMHLAPPQSGAVMFEGVGIGNLPPHRIARLGIGYVPEERRIFGDLSVAENLEVGGQPVRHSLPAWTPERLYDLFPNLGERRHALGGTLSGGEQQMLTIARTLMGNPRLLLLDEPSEGIAPVIVEQMIATIATLKDQGVTMLLSEQNLRFARMVADRALIIDGGTIRFDGTFETLDVEGASARYLAV